MVQVDARLMNEVVRRIVETISPQKVILFGSQARGNARSESDGVCYHCHPEGKSAL